MGWTKKRLKDKPTKNFSLAKELKRNGKITSEFEVVINNLSLEELIGLKLAPNRYIIFSQVYPDFIEFIINTLASL